jgi:hypothetical protein
MARLPRWLELALALVLAAAPARAHNVPIPDSRCALDPIEITVPGTPGVVTVASPAADDRAQISWRGDDDTATFRNDAAAPRAFTMNGLGGTIALPTTQFDAHIFYTTRITGDLVWAGVSLALDYAGTAATVSVPFTTALLPFDGGVAAGAPVDDTGRFSAVGVATGPEVAAAFGRDSVLVRLDCHAEPGPDFDQFQFTSFKLLAGSIRAGLFTVKGTLEPGFVPPPDFGTEATLLRASTGDQTIAAAHLAQGLPRKGRKRRFAGRSDDGQARVTVRFARSEADLDVYAVTMRVKGAVLPAVADRDVPVDLAFQGAGLVFRTSGVFRANRKGSRLKLLRRRR